MVQSRNTEESDLMRTIRILLVSENAIERAGLRASLEVQEHLHIIAEVGSGAQAIAIMSQTKPDVVIMDINMPGMDRLQAAAQINALYPNCMILVLTAIKDRPYFFEMLSAGVTGYLTKQVSAEELTTAVNVITDGDVYLQPALAKWLLDEYRHLTAQSIHRDTSSRVDGSSLEVLSDRERQVLKLVAEGLTTPKIAQRLRISPKTVSRHRERIMSKLDIHSSAELVKFAIRTGLIEI